MNTGLNHTGESQWLRAPVSLRTASCSSHSPSILRIIAHHTAPETILARSNCQPLFSRGGVSITFNYLFHFLALDIEKLRHLQIKPWFDYKSLVTVPMLRKTPAEYQLMDKETPIALQHYFSKACSVSFFFPPELSVRRAKRISHNTDPVVTQGPGIRVQHKHLEAALTQQGHQHSSWEWDRSPS